jgi:hypothetical protein
MEDFIMANNLKKINFVISTNAAETEDGMYLDELWILGWDNNTDWFCDIDSQDIMTPLGNVKKHQFGMIHTSSHETAYVGTDIEDVEDYCKSAIKEGYNCCICRLEKDQDNNIRIFKV